ncbi:MAG: hypothetical protein RLZZ214_2646 [Verrucomicrobiota bacterium]
MTAIATITCFPGDSNFGKATRARNHAAISPTHQVARNPISATNTRGGNPKSARRNWSNFIRVKYSGEIV